MIISNIELISSLQFNPTYFNLNKHAFIRHIQVNLKKITSCVPFSKTFFLNEHLIDVRNHFSAKWLQVSLSKLVLVLPTWKKKTSTIKDKYYTHLTHSSIIHAGILCGLRRVWISLKKSLSSCFKCLRLVVRFPLQQWFSPKPQNPKSPKLIPWVTHNFFTTKLLHMAYTWPSLRQFKKKTQENVTGSAW